MDLIPLLPRTAGRDRDASVLDRGARHARSVRPRNHDRIVVALLLGAVIGLEREWESKPAGMRTFALVSEGAALFMIGGILLFNEVRDAGGATGDPNRVTSTIVQGIGFLAAGVIILPPARSRLTTAVAIWATAAIGMLVGAGFILPAVVGVVSTMIMLTIFRRIEDRLTERARQVKRKSEGTSE
ncbi:MAG: MgtC/SapB family protein [Thermomicrobiales bacterium]